MTAPLDLTTGHTPDGAPKLTAAGEIDLTNVTEFARALAGALEPDRRLLVDLTRVDYLDSAALAALFTHAARLDILISPLNQTLLTLSGLTELTHVEVVEDPSTTADSPQA